MRAPQPGTTAAGAPSRVLSRLGAAGAAVSVAVVLSVAPASAETAGWLDQLVGEDCPVLFVLGVQGTGESSADAPVKADTGMLSQVMGPLLDSARRHGVSVDRAYVPYPAGFGGAVPGGPEPYLESVAKGVENLAAAAGRVLSDCPGTALAAVGYSQGGHVVSRWLADVGRGASATPPGAVAAGSVFGSPTRPAGAGVFPGTPATAPAPVPGTRGGAVGALPAISHPAPAGAGIGPAADTADYGALAGRVAEWCQAGDLACDAPVDAPVGRAVVQVAGQAAIGGDPFTALESIGRSLANAAFTVAVDSVNEDIHVPGNTLANLSIEPRMPISERVAAATAPGAAAPSGQDALAAITKVGLIAATSVVSVAQKVITPETIATLAAVGLVNPPAALAILAAKVGEAVADLVPPATASRVVAQTFEIVSSEIEANRDLFDIAALARYTDTAAHGSYSAVPVTPTGLTPARYAAEWLAAVAKDLAASAPVTSPAASTPTSRQSPPPPTTAIPATAGETGRASSAPAAAPAPTGGAQP